MGVAHWLWPCKGVLHLFLLTAFYILSTLSTLLIIWPSCMHTDVHEKCLSVVTCDADSMDGLTAWMA